MSVMRGSIVFVFRFFALPDPWLGVTAMFYS
jgi:hypothetical protein